MQLPGGLEENFRFLVLETSKQVEDTLAFLQAPTPRQMEHITGRDDYIDSLKSLIEEKVYSLLISSAMNRRSANLLRSVNTIATNLERIGDFAVNVVGQMQYLQEPEFINAYAYAPFFAEVTQGLGAILEAMESQDITQAFRICHSEFVLDDLYKGCFDTIRQQLARGKNTEDLLTTLFIIRYLERMGDSLLNIGEAIIFAILGERLKIHQFQALKDSLSTSGMDTPISDVEFESIWGTRGGCRIGKVQDRRNGAPTDEHDSAQPVIFKEGAAGKLLQERDNILLWHGIMPNLAPKVFGFQAKGDSASILLEFLEGCTVQEIILNSDQELIENTMFLLTETLGIIWQATREDGPVKAGFLGQLASRLEDVYRVHPGFRTGRQSIGALGIEPLADMLGELTRRTSGLCSPFSVFIHGDFNVNNIIYNHHEQRLHFIDLHRSAPSDYVQDVSVFLISNFRLPVQRSTMRDRINMFIREFHRFAASYAQAQGDRTFSARLALGLIRSFITSTRFELNESFAQVMHLRGLYLIEKMLAHGTRPWEEFQLPLNVLIY